MPEYYTSRNFVSESCYVLCPCFGTSQELNWSNLIDCKQVQLTDLILEYYCLIFAIMQILPNN